MGWITQRSAGDVSSNQPRCSPTARRAGGWGLAGGVVAFGASLRTVGFGPAALWGSTAAALFAGLPVIYASTGERNPVADERTLDKYRRLNPWRFARQPLVFAVVALFAALVGLAATLTFGQGHAFRIAGEVIVSGLVVIAVGLAELMWGTRIPRPGCVDYEKVRSQIEHEDDLVNHRVSWLMTSQAFLFGAYALGYAPRADAPADLSNDPGVFQIIPIVALIAAFIMYLSVVAAVAALENVRISYLAESPDEPECRFVASSGLVLYAGELTPLALPVLLICTWAPLALHTQ